MSAYIKPLNVVGVKVVNVHPENIKKYRLPTVMATILLIDPKTGIPYTIMDGKWITDMRIGAASAVATRYLARKNSHIVGIVGAGAQARTQLLALNEVMTINEVRVSSLALENSKKFAEEMTCKTGLKINAVESNEESVKGCDILITTTPSRKPIIKNEWIKPGMHINAIGADAPGKEELDPLILKRAKIVVDDYEQAFHGGEVNVPLSKGIIGKESIYAELGEIILGKKAGRISDDEITVFDSTGLAIQDIIVAYRVYLKAKSLELGKEIELL